MEWEFALPMPVNSAHQSKPSEATSPESATPKPAPQSKTDNPSGAKAKATQEAKRQGRQEYDGQRNQTPERRQHRRLLAQERRRKAKELGQCRNCSEPSIPGQTRCPTCAEKHRESRIRSNAKRKNLSENAAVTSNSLARSSAT